MILQEEELLGAVSNEGGNHYESEGIRKPIAKNAKLSKGMAK